MDHQNRPAAAESDGEQTQPRTETAIFDDDADTQIMSDNPETEVEWLSDAELSERYR